MNIGEQIKERRAELNMTQNELADKLAVSRSAISNWETDKNYPDLQLIVKLSDVLQISLDTLLKGDADVVEKIAKDTNDSKKLRGKTKWLLGLVTILIIILLIGFFFFFLWSGEINKPDQVNDMRIENNELIIEVETPDYYGQRSWYMDLDETGTIANVTIVYSFGKKRPGNDVMTAAVNTDDPTDILSKDSMKRLKEIRIVTSRGEVVRTLEVTDQMRDQ